MYGAWARTAYHRNGQLNGNAWVGGLRLAGPRKSEWRTQYQFLDENYELMGHHKIEHHPTNFQGLQTTLSIPIKNGSVNTVLYRLYQIDTNTHEGDTIFGDSYFPALANSKRGDITVYRVGGDYDFGQSRVGLPKLSTYYRLKEKEKDRFRASLMYHHYDFVDSIAASSGQNNYQANQVVMEVYGVF